MDVRRSRPSDATRSRRPLWALAGMIGAAPVALALVTAPPAAAATLFGDTFSDGDRAGWSTNGGSWSVVTDGSLALRQSSSVTVSWNRFRGTDKNMLLGHDDSNGPQDIGRLTVTYHHNWFDGSRQRNPRVRFGEPVHVFNNYYLRVTGYGVASQMNAGVVVEGNYFDTVEKPTRNDVGGEPGRIVQRRNIFVNSDPPVSAGTVEEPGRYYSYTLDDPARIPALVSAGVGRIGA